MKKILLLIPLLVWVFSCDSGASIIVDPVEPEKGAMNLVLPDNAELNAASADLSVTSFSIEVQGVDVTYSQAKTGLPGDSVSFDALEPGNYTITVKGQDSSLNCILTGSAQVIVVAGESTPVTITLQWVAGEIVVGIELPGTGQGTGTDPIRVQSNGYKTFTYDADGIITQVEEITTWNYIREEFTVSNGLRVSSMIYEDLDPANAQGAPHLYSSVISHDAQGREIKFEYTYADDGSPYFDLEIVYDASGRTESRYRYIEDASVIPSVFNRELQSVKVFDGVGRTLSEEYYSGSFWTYWFDYEVKNPGDVIKVIYGYWGDTWHRISEELHVNGSLLTTTSFIMKDPGVYLYGGQTSFDGHLLYEINYSQLFAYTQDYYAQTMIKTPQNGWYAQTIEVPFASWVDPHEARSQTILYSTGFEGRGTTSYPLVMETGEVKAGQIENIF